jgi:hypothetical protein
MWDPLISLPLSAPGPPVSVPSPRGCHTPAPRLRGAVGTACVRPDSRPRPDHAPPLTASPRCCPLLTACVPTRHATDADQPLPLPPRCRRRAARAASLSTPRRPDNAVADSAGKPWCRRLRRAAVHVPVRPRHALPRTASRAPTLCHWAAGGFGPVSFDLYFYIF